MKTTKNTVKNHSTLTVITNGDKNIYASRESLIQSLVKGYKNKLWSKTSEIGFEKITTGDGENIQLHKVYWDVYIIISRIKDNYKNIPKKVNRAEYYKEKGYLFDMKDRDNLDNNEPKGKKVLERGFYFYEEPIFRKNERNWKSFRKKQYKL